MRAGPADARLSRARGRGAAGVDAAAAHRRRITREAQPWESRSSSSWRQRRPSDRTTGPSRWRPAARPSPSSGITTATGRSSSRRCRTVSRCASVASATAAAARSSRPTAASSTSPATTAAPSATTSTGTRWRPASSSTFCPTLSTLAPLPDPDISPDGRQLALTVAHGAGYAVAVMPAEPGLGEAAIRHLTEHPYTECSPRWSPDGARLAVTSGTHGQDTAIFVIDAESGATSIARRLRGLLRRPARLVARRAAHRLLGGAGRPPGDRHLRARDGLHQLGLGGRSRRRPPSGLGPGRRRARLPRRRRGRDRPLPHRPSRRLGDRVQHRARQPLRAVLHARRRRPRLRPERPGRASGPLPRRARRRRRERAHRSRCRRSSARRPSPPAARSGSRAGTTWPRSRASSSSRTSPTGPPSSSSTAARPGTTPTSGTCFDRRSSSPD